MTEKEYLKKLCVQFQSSVTDCPESLYETACKVREAMGDEVANKVNARTDNNNPFLAEWISFKFATLMITENSSWVKEGIATRRKRARDAIKLLERLEKIVSEQIERWSEDGHRQVPYPLYFEGDDDLRRLGEIKRNQQMLLDAINEDPLKNYDVTVLDRVCSQAVILAGHFGFGKSSSKTLKAKGMEESFSPIERMVQAILPEEDRQSIKSAIETARRRPG